MDKVERRDRPKSLGRTRGATLGTAVKALFGPYRSPHNDRIHLRSLAQTPFRTVSPRTPVNRGKKKGRGLPRNSPYLAIIADLVHPFVEDDLVMPLAAVHEVLPAREPFVVERVDLVISISPYQRVVAVIAIQGVVALAAVEAVLPIGTVRVVPVIVASHHVVSWTAVEGVVAEVTV